MCYRTKQLKKVEELEARYNAKLYNNDAREAFNIPFYDINGFTHPEYVNYTSARYW